MPKKYLFIILVLSLITRFAFFGYPAETVFDEVHFGKFVSGYFNGNYFFDIHPPLGKLLIAGVAKITDFKPGFSFETIGQKFPDDSYKWLRFLPKLAGTLLPVVIFLIALELISSDATVGAPTASRRGQKFAFLAGLLTVFENSLLTQSRFILLDSFLLLFGFLGILFYLKGRSINYKRSPVTNTSYLFLAGVFTSLAASIKWTGFSFLALILIFYFLKTSNYKTRVSRLEFFFKGLFLLIIVPFLIYFSIFAIHFSLLDKPGPGLAFHPSDFQNSNIFKKFLELNMEIYQSNARLTASHPYSSQWYEWPFMTRPIYYWNGPSFAEAPTDAKALAGRSEGTVARIYFLGNPLIYWLSTIAVIYFLIPFKLNFKSIWIKNPTCLFFLTAYFLNLLPFIFIGRVMFLYHYFTSLIFAILILVYLLDKLPEKNQKTVFNSVLIGSIILFFFFSPLTYGLEIPDWYYKLTVWLPTWK